MNCSHDQLMGRYRVSWETTSMLDNEMRRVRCFGMREPGTDGKFSYGFAMMDRETREDLTDRSNTQQSMLSTMIDMLIAAGVAQEI
jgi:hypothetical protein